MLLWTIKILDDIRMEKKRVGKYENKTIMFGHGDEGYWVNGVCQERITNLQNDIITWSRE